jgi:HEAT repeat protein
MVTVAKSDPNYSVRQSAIDALSRVPGDAGFNALEEILRTDQDERVQRSIVGALMRSDNAKARSSMRALIDRKDAPIALRIEAINSFSGDRATADDASYLRGLYAKAESDNFKRAIIDAVSRTGGPDNDQWLMSLAKNTNESSSIRAEAIGRMMRSNIPVADVSKLYDAADSYSMRSQIINVLRSRKEPEAADKLVDIVKNGTDYKLRSQAINALTSRNDPRSQQLMTDILDGKKP